jgi:predicted PurR-regulated permease PerM
MAGFVALLVVLFIALYVCWLMLQPFFNVLLWATVLAVVFYPMHRRVRARTGRPTLAAALSTLLVIVFILLPVTFITVAVVRELTGAATQIQAGMTDFSLASWPRLAWAMDWVGQYIHLDREAAQKFVIERMQTWGALLASSTLVVVGGAVGAIVQMVLVVFTLFYFFRDGERIKQAAYRMLPIERVQANDIALRTREVIAATVNGVLVIAAIQGTLGTLIFSILGLPSALLWGVVMFFLCMIPMAGAFLVWAPAALFLAFTGAWTRAIVLIVWGVLVVGSIDNVLSPRLVGHRTRLHELLVFFSVLGGLEAFGVLGVVLGPVIVAVTLAIIEMVRHANRPPEETLKEEGVIEAQDDVRQTVTAETGKDLAGEGP